MIKKGFGIFILTVSLQTGNFQGCLMCPRNLLSNSVTNDNKTSSCITRFKKLIIYWHSVFGMPADHLDRYE